MTLPALTVQYQGQSQVSADNLNTYLQSCNVVTDLRGFVGITGMYVSMGGYTSVGDGGQGIFYWNANGSAADDAGVTTIVPSGAAAGEWTRLTGGSTVSANSPIFPMGRLTLTSGAPVMTADATAQSTVYYAPYIGSLVPIYNGVGFISYAFTQKSLALDSNSGHTGYQQSGKLFDVFAFINNSAVTIGTGPAWSTSTSRGTGAGTTQLTQLNGVWTNTVSIALKIDTTTTQVTVGVGQATYLGTIYATANGQTGMAFKPAAASGGGNNILGLYNAYNRVRNFAMSKDSTASWTYNSGTWRAADNSTGNRITYIDGLQQSSIDSFYEVSAATAANNNALSIGVNLDSASATPGTSSNGTSASSSGFVPMTVAESFSPQLGLHYVQAMEQTDGSTVTFTGNTKMALKMSVDM